MLLLVLRELRDLPGSVIGAHARQLKQKWLHRQNPAMAQPGYLDPEQHAPAEIVQPAPTPLSWQQIGLAILPGLVMLYHDWQGELNFILLGSSAILYLLLTTIHARATRQLPVWSYPFCGFMLYCLMLPALASPTLLSWFFVLLIPLMLASWSYAIFCLSALRKQIVWHTWVPVVGMVLGLVLMIVFTNLFRSPQGWPAWWPIITEGLLVAPFTSWLALAAIPLALRQGLRAALLVLGLGFVTWAAFSLDFTYAIAGSAWANLMLAIWTLMLLVLAPLWVLRARTRNQQLLGLTVPLLIALVAIVPLEAMTRATPHLLTDFFDLYRYFPHSDEYSVGVGTRAAHQFVPLLWQNGIEAAALFINWFLIVLLYDGLARMKARPASSVLPSGSIHKRASR